MTMHSDDSPTQRSRLEASLAPLREAQHMPGYIYDSDAVFALEKEKVFMKDWLCMGRVEEIENPGDYMTARVLDEPIVLARNPEGG
jgi:choline monooxygenase